MGSWVAWPVVMEVKRASWHSRGLTIDCSNQQLSGFALMTDASRLRDPQAASDLLMYRLNKLMAVSGSLVIRL